ncbi:hypothetical protein FK220_014980 [Flavobacteriaceae bacterium TP-CH-4]|uniref:Uncharacterized protein n=1 Tax=Pelagihabitans pacificus TaxID=2696054 RepID=A0A967B018_9FLAO|nr:hypothetical protein [Pelagihabitans pacificus]NHF60657.1 hypothetical protein [Pelagihabitans pacificus]
MKNRLTAIALVGMTMMLGCTQSKYTQLVKEEMASGVTYDSLFLGLKLGQTKRQFFDLCWQLNLEKKVTNSEAQLVQYQLPSKDDATSVDDITMLFYGDFDDQNKMIGMDLQFYYDAWSIWNKELQSDQLVHTLKDTLQKWYPGNEFIKIPMKKDSMELWVKVDGNRRIVIRPLDDKRIVKARIDDLRYVLEK